MEQIVAHDLQHAVVTGKAQPAIELAAKNLSLYCNACSVASGWWHDTQTGQKIDPKTPFLIPAKLALIHSEISEAMEGDRKDLMDDKLPNRKMFEVELADAVIRIFDLAGACNLDLAGAIFEKLQFNANRADHKVENRNAENGKSY